MLHSEHGLPNQEHTCLKSSSLFSHRVPFLLCRPIRSNVMNTFLVFILHSVHDLPDQEHTYKVVFTVQSSSSIPVVQANTVQCDEHIPGIYLIFGTWPTWSRTHMSKVVFTVQSWSSIPVVQANTVMNTFLVFILHSVHDLPDQEHTCRKSSSLFNHRVPFQLCRQIRSNVMNTFLVFILHSVHDLPDQEHTCLETSSLFSHRIPFRLCRPVRWWTHSWYLFIFYSVQDLPDQEHMCLKSSSLFNHRVPFLLCRPIRSNVMNTFLALLSTLRSDYSIDQQTVVACPSQVASSVGFFKLPYGGGGMTLIIPNFLVVLFRG